MMPRICSKLLCSSAFERVFSRKLDYSSFSNILFVFRLIQNNLIISIFWGSKGKLFKTKGGRGMELTGR